MDYTVNVTESQYGSWTKLSLAGSTPDTIQEQVGSETEEVGVTTQFLTQPPSEQQDSILSELSFNFHHYHYANFSIHESVGYIHVGAPT
jgi:hypothetical protein